MARIPRIPVREQDPQIRAKNFKEVCLGYSDEEAMLEARRCLKCKKPACMTACPVSVKIPFFVEQSAKGNFEEAAKVIAIDSSLPAICGRVCPQDHKGCIRNNRYHSHRRLGHEPVSVQSSNGYRC